MMKIKSLINKMKEFSEDIDRDFFPRDHKEAKELIDEIIFYLSRLNSLRVLPEKLRDDLTDAVINQDQYKIFNKEE